MVERDRQRNFEGKSSTKQLIRIKYNVKFRGKRSEKTVQNENGEKDLTSPKKTPSGRFTTSRCEGKISPKY